ncbi:phosphate ABC transporter permease PstA [Streptacidiphilus sp. P02-A3a]|uniref:phosphate ABC transporter permease PstA n=1 Tax=Streptacidiphilus sp. P02-A3a TaxID=2704468 RepID=UPI0015FB3AEF|nr:phosphate ABC transporter permease PstA [Streptacidiphilus sp. P02-A3a]QMU71536.1 phosphate ABC transporter permease PstA [Streptacidiphilus sp. P02-A3a]
MTEQTIPASALEATVPLPKVTAEPAARPQPERRIRRRAVTLDGACALLGSGLGALGLTWLVYERLLPTSGALGFWVSAFLVFLALYAGVTALVWGPRAVADRLAAACMAAVGVFIVFVVVDQVAYTAYQGHTALGHLNFFTQDSLNSTALTSLGHGGILNALIGSLEQMGIATAAAVPLGILAALFLVEVGGRMARPVRSLIEAMTSLPEIIAGLFVFALFILTFGLRQSGFAAALALTIMMIPFVARSSEVMLRLVPGTLREASYALGASQWRTVWSVVLPTARSGLTTAIVLGMARAIGETAPVLLTSGYTDYVNANPFSGWQTSLPLYIYETVREPADVQRVRAFGAALVLIALVLVLFTVARVLGGRAPGELSRRQRRRVARDRLAHAAAAPVGHRPGRSAADLEGETNESA